MELEKKKYKRADVEAMLAAYSAEYEQRLAEQREIIANLSKEKAYLLVELEKLSEKEKLISATLLRAESTAQELKEQAELQYSLEIERLNRFSVAWDAYFEKIKEKYPESSAVKRAIKIKDKAKSVDKNRAKKAINELDAMLGKDSSANFNPKSKICDYIASTSESGFNLNEVLNPGNIKLEDICKELGLIEEKE